MGAGARRPSMALTLRRTIAASDCPCFVVKGPLCRPLGLGQSPQSQQLAASSSGSAVGGLWRGVVWCVVVDNGLASRNRWPFRYKAGRQRALSVGRGGGLGEPLAGWAVTDIRGTYRPVSPGSWPEGAAVREDCSQGGGVGEPLAVWAITDTRGPSSGPSAGRGA